MQHANLKLGEVESGYPLRIELRGERETLNLHFIMQSFYNIWLQLDASIP